MATAIARVERRLTAVDAELAAHRRLGTDPPASRLEDLEAELASVVAELQRIKRALGDGDEHANRLAR
jgi:capsule polysaccharide export protein KpsE/RkpR